MKKRITVVFLLLLMTLCLSSCMFFLIGRDTSRNTEVDSSSLQVEEIAVFTDETMLPMQFAISEDDKFVFLLQDYDKQYSRISVGESATKLDVVYDSGDYSIKNMACGNGFTAWTELTDDAYAIKYYDHKSNTTTVIRSGHYDYDTDYQILEIKAYRDSVYYTLYNNDEDYASIMCYNVSSGSESEYMTADFYMPERYDFMQYESLDINDGWLLCSQRTASGDVDVWMINLDDESNMLCHLNPDVLVVYGASYDEASNTLALYYSELESSEHIGTCIESAAITDLVDFSKSSIAYRDRIRFADGNLYYIEQTAGEPSVNSFRFCVVSANDQATSEYRTAFSYFVSDGSVYLLSYDSDSPFESVHLLSVVQ
jgi:hypothetical protein